MNRSARKRHDILLTIILILVTLVWGSPGARKIAAFAQSGTGWSEPVMISTTTVKSWFPDIAVDNRGRAHIVWHSEKRQGQDLLDLLMYATWDGETYSEPNDIIFPGIGGWTVRPVIAADSQGKLHMAYRDGSEIYYTQAPADTAWNAISWMPPYLISGLRGAYYSDIAVDSKGVVHVVWNEQPSGAEENKMLWFGASQGVSLLEGEILASEDGEPWAGDYVVHAMLEDAQGIQWVGTAAGLGRFDGVTWRWLTAGDGLAGNEIFTIAEDADGTLWFGTDGGLSHYDPLQPSEDEQWTTVPMASEIASAKIQVIVVDDAGGVWVGTSGGLGKYDGQTWQVYHAEDGLTGKNITALTIDHRNVLWVGADNGLFRCAGGREVRFAMDDTLTNVRVTALAVGRDNVLWVGTEYGLARHDGENWQLLTARDGMLDNHVTALTVDSEDILWVGTVAGVSRYDGEGWTSYTVEDGLIDGQITSVVEDEIPNAMCPMCMDIFYRHSADGGQTWSAPVNLSDSYAGSVKPQIKIDGEDGVHVTWEEGEDWYIGEGYPFGSVHRYSGDGGNTWAEPFTFTHPDAPPQQITLGIGRDGELVAVWRLPLQLAERRPVYYQRSTDNGASWSEPEPIESILAKDWLPMSLDSCHAASDSAGNIHLLVLGYLSPLEENLSLIYTVWDGQKWSQPYRLYSSNNPPEWPRIAVGMGNSIHATWFTRDEAHIWDSERGHYQVWAARKQADAPLLTPVPTPAFVPTPTSASATSLVPTSTPLPAIPQDSAPPSEIYTDFDDALRLLIALLPLVALIGVLLIVRARRGL